jgi:GNAT superfamily N-acetyltransferase
MSARVRIRSAAAGDAPFLRVTCRTYLPEAALLELITRGDVVVAELDGSQVGYAALDRIGAVNPFLAAIHVLEPHRRAGIGRALLGELERRTASRGHEVLYSSSTADEAAPQSWHRRMGLRGVRIRRGVQRWRSGRGHLP